MNEKKRLRLGMDEEAYVALDRLAAGELRNLNGQIEFVLVLGRVLVANHDDLRTAYDLSKQIALTPFKP